MSHCITVIGHGVADVDGAFSGGRGNQYAAAGLADMGVEARIGFNAVREDTDDVTVGIGVVGSGINGDLPTGANLDLVIDGSRFLVVLPPGRDADRDGSGVDRTLPVNHFVPERVRSCTVTSGDEIDEAASRRRGSHGGCAVDAGELHRVAVGIDAVQRDRDPDAASGHDASGQVLRLRARVLGAFQGKDVDGYRGSTLLALRVHCVIDGAHSFRCGSGDEAQGLLGNERLAVLFGNVLGQDRVHRKLFTLRVCVVVQDRNGDDVVHPHVHFVRFRLGSFDDGGSRHRDDAHRSGR
ncbi:hypothetical protein PJL18_01128 [Paenarthrobacter nicotinovorans]|nr:hypothetical protein [Paenarthrobacter nicotinovorans]